MSDVRPLYAVLNVPATATLEDIKFAYRLLALAHHPDKHQTSEQNAETKDAFARIAFAYEVLGDVQRRKRYDLTGELPQNDAALGRAANETFLAEYVRAAPKAPREITQKDMSLHSLDNYEVLELDGRNVPAYMRGIVMQGLGYLVRAIDQMEEKEVVLLRHYVMDQMYALLAYTPPLDESAFSTRGYIITYYDHPLQAGIQPSWSDQNENKLRGTSACDLRYINPEIFQQRKLAALEWKGVAPAPIVAPILPKVPGEGLGSERLYLATCALVRIEPDVVDFDIHHLREKLAQILDVLPSDLKQIRSTELMGLVFTAIEEEEEAAELRGTPQQDNVAIENCANSPDVSVAHAVGGPIVDRPAAPTSAPIMGMAQVKATGRIGQILVHDPDDLDLTYKLKFSDGCSPEMDWFRAAAIETVETSVPSL